MAGMKRETYSIRFRGCIRGVAVAAVLSMPAACGVPGDVVVLLPDEDGVTRSVVVRSATGAVELNEPLAAVAVQPSGALSDVMQLRRADVSAAFAGALNATPRPVGRHIVHFVLGEAVVEPGSIPALAVAIDAARATEHADISVTGHSDAIGSDQFNLELSLLRAQAVRDSLTRAGVPAPIIEVSYHGANNPLVPTPKGTPEPRNRRVEITVR